jgi:nucleotide-binding universal stress UspA family protein
MFRFSKILALYDFSLPSQRALGWAVRLSSSFRSELKVAAVLGPEEEKAFPRGSDKDVERLIRADADRHFRRALQKDSRAELEACEVAVSRGAPSAALLKLIEREKPGLVVVGSHGRTGLAHVFLGSVAERIVRYSPAPVLVARTDPVWPPSKVLVPLDFSKSDAEILQFAADLRSAVPASFDLLHVLSFQETAGVIYPEAVAAWSAGEKSEKEKEAERRLREEAAWHPHLPAATSVAVGAPVSEILDKARRAAADLILIATHGRTGLPRFFLGSVAEQVVRYAPCSVLSFCPEKAVPARLEAVKALPEGFESQLAEYGDGD